MNIALSLRTLKTSLLRPYAVVLAAIAGMLLVASPALAHHPFGGETPDSFLTAFLSGLGHPVIGLDHLAFVIAAGLLAAAMGRSLSIPAAFVVASLAGTGLHLLALDLPIPELIISASVLVFGGLLALKNRPGVPVAIALAAIAGVFHGYAYGEAIVGAEMGPLVAYLLGFSLVQMAIAAAAYWLGRRVTAHASEASGLALRFAGFAICGVGGAFLSSLILEAVFPG